MPRTDQTTSPDTVRVFVYGTLLTGYGNHALVAELVEETHEGTVSGFRLLDVGAFPGARPADRYGVRGEVLTLSHPDEAMHRLDALEGVPTLYTRQRVSVALDDGSSVEAWMYVLSPRHAKRCGALEATEGGADSWRAHKPPRLNYWRAEAEAEATTYDHDTTTTSDDW